MYRQPFCSFQLAGLNLNDFGLPIPSPFCSLELSNSEISSFTTWTLVVTIGGDDSRKMNVAAFEALLYSAAQTASKESTSAGIPVSFMFGWLNGSGSVDEYISYQGTTTKFESSVQGMFMTYRVTGYASIAIKSNMPVLNIPAVKGYVQPSAVVEALAKAVKADSYYELDIDHNDCPTFVSHGAMSTSFTQYVRGDRNGQDDYESFPGLVTLSKSYNASRDAAGLVRGVKTLSSVLNHVRGTDVSKYLKKSLTDNTPQCNSFAFWIDEPTMTSKGKIHYKSKSSIMANQSNTLQYGTANSNILSLTGSYNGVAYNISDMNFADLGFSLDGSGNTIVNTASVVNSWSNSLSEVFQTASIINDINALATQFSGKFDVVIPGSVKQFGVCEPVSLVVMNGNTLSPISGIYSIMSVSHNISTTFTTSLRIQRLAISSANQTALSLGIYVPGSSSIYGEGAFVPTKNIISTGKVDFGTLYPTMIDIATM